MTGRDELGHRRQMSQFCGQESFCGGFNSQRSMIAAMRNVEKYYKVVGVTEMFEESLRVLEYKLPDVFRGLTNLYRERYKKKVNLWNILIPD